MNNNLDNDWKLSIKYWPLTSVRNKELAECALLGFLNIIKKWKNFKIYYCHIEKI